MFRRLGNLNPLIEQNRKTAARQRHAQGRLQPSLEPLETRRLLTITSQSSTLAGQLVYSYEYTPYYYNEIDQTASAGNIGPIQDSSTNSLPSLIPGISGSYNISLTSQVKSTTGDGTDSGSVNIVGSLNATSASPEFYGFSGAAGADYSFSFIANVTGTFTAKYNNRSMTSPTLYSINSTGSYFSTSTKFYYGSGLYTQSVLKGHEYGFSVHLFNNDSASSGTGLADNSSANLSWQVTATRLPSKTSLTTSANSSIFGKTVTFDGSVTSNNPNAPVPSGKVTLMDGQTEIDVGTLSSGMISFQTSRLSVGDHAITLIYDGDNNYEGSVSPTLNFQVNSPTVVTQYQNINLMHKLLYAYQNLAVNVSVTNNSAEEVTGTETFYLSTNQNATVQGDGTALLAIGNIYLDLLPGQTGNLPQGTDTLTVTIPGNIQPGTYYLKAVFAGSNDESEDTVAVSPALVTCVNSSGNVSNFSSFPQNAAIFDNAVNNVKAGNASIYPITSVKDIENFVKLQETGSAGTQAKWYVYKDVYNTSGSYVPAIGYGSDLENKYTGAVNAIDEKIIKAYLKQNPQLTFTWEDYLKPSSHAYIDQATADALFNAGFQVAENYVQTHYANITSINLINQEAALIDIAYNIGTSNTSDPSMATKGLAAFKSMNADIALGTTYGYACAGLELVNSQRTTQVSPARTKADFYLLTSFSGVAAQL